MGLEVCCIELIVMETFERIEHIPPRFQSIFPYILDDRDNFLRLVETLRDQEPLDTLVSFREIIALY